MKFKGFQDVYKPCLRKKTLTAILSGLNALINLRIFNLTTPGAKINLKALLCIVKGKRRNNLE